MTEKLTKTRNPRPLHRLVRRRYVRYQVWTDEDGLMAPHPFAAGRVEAKYVQLSAKWWAEEALGCYVQLHDRKGRIVASAGEHFDAPNVPAQRPPAKDV